MLRSKMADPKRDDDDTAVLKQMLDDKLFELMAKHRMQREEAMIKHRAMRRATVRRQRLPLKYFCMFSFTC